MKYKLKSMPLAIVQIIASGALTAAVAQPVMAQSADAPAAVQRVVVTGSLISRTDTETPTPVQVLTAADIQRSGKTSVGELLSDLAANGAGTLGTGFSGAFANGASGVSLRGLTTGATLVLLDGHRVAPYPLSDDSQRSFVDVTSIPLDAIDSIEVLKSGASSLYGSDAIAGVVNIKLKKNLNGTRVSAESGTTQHGGGRTNRASLSTGFGDLDADGYNAFATVEWRRQGAIKMADREQFVWDQADWRSRGGNNIQPGVPVQRIDPVSGQPKSVFSFLVPANSPFLYNAAGTGGIKNAANFQFLDPAKCNYDLYMSGGCAIRDTVSNIQPATENINVLAGFTKKLGGDWELGLKASLFERNSVNNRGISAAYSPITYVGNNVVAGGSVTPGVGAVPVTAIPATASFNKLGVPARLYGIIPDIDPNSSKNNTSKSTRFALDLKGSAFGWDIQAAGGITEAKLDIDYSGYVDRKALYAAINSPTNTWNPLGGNNPALVESISPHFSGESTSKLNYVDLVGSRELMTLGAGPLALATGVHWHKREQNAPPPALTANGQVARTEAFVIGSETDTAAFAELQATPIKDVELHVSSRYDHYDTYGKSFTPAASFKWTPMQQLGFRGTFARGFRAPGPAEVGNAGSSFTFNAINDPILCADGNQATPGNVPSACGIAPPYVQITNKNLAPEKSKSYTLGIIVEPIKGLNATLDYYNIQVNNQIVTSAGNDPSYNPVWVRGPISPVDIVQPNGTTAQGTPAAGPIIYATSPYVNLGSTKTSGIEADVGYRWRMGENGTLRANVSAAHVFSYLSIAADGTTYQLAGTQGPSVVGGATGNPKDRATFTLGWNRGPLDLTATANYTSSFSTLDESVGATSCASTGFVAGGRRYFQGVTQPDYYCHVASFTTVNLNLLYKVTSNLSVRAAILNVFDRQPPIDVGTYGNSGPQTSYNASLHQAGAIGRFFSLGMNYTF